MNTTTMIKPPRTSNAGHQRSATPHARPPASEFPHLGERLNEILPLVFVVPVAGPPVILLVGPLLLLVLLLIPPAAFLITLVVAGVVMTGLLAMLVGLAASPFLLVRHLYTHRTRPATAHIHNSTPNQLTPEGL